MKEDNVNEIVCSYVCFSAAVHDVCVVPISLCAACQTQQPPNVMAEIAAGLSVGVSETLVGYPFLTLKTMVQNKVPLRGLTLPRLYQGARYPFVSSIGFNALVFPLTHRLHHRHHLPYAYCGALAGLAVTPQCWFLDTFTIRRQTNQRVHRHMFRKSKGFGMTAVRESTALAAYFGTYHSVREYCSVPVAGGVAGLVNWGLTFPVDTLRTRQIAQKCDLRTALAQGQLWRGVHFALIRAVVVNAASFSVFETVLGMFTTRRADA